MGCMALASWFLLLSGWLTLHADAASVPVLITRGNHYSVGKDMGSTFKHQISSFFAQDTLMTYILLPWLNTIKGRKIYSDYLHVANTSYPQYIEELQGVSDGSGVPFDQIFLNIMRREITGLMGQTRYTADACTDIHVCRSQMLAFAHNEDGWSLVEGYAYIVVADIVNDRPRGLLTVPTESYTAYVYPGTIAGLAFGFNGHGLAFSVNALYPKEVLKKKMGHYILNRAMMSATKPQEVIDILRNSGVGIAYGTSINLGDLHSQALYNIEVAPNPGQNSSLLNVKKITTHDRNYYHVNMYRRLPIPEDPDHIISSLHRTARIANIPPPASKQEVLNILGDREDTAWPIYRHHEKDNSSTLCTAYFDLQKWTMDLYLGNPAKGSSPLHVFDIPKTSAN